jgi:predicted enzyme related to lactoylglutathione lyase
VPRIIHFDVVADDVPRAIAFYEAAFGWKIEKWDGPMDYWLIATGDRSKEGIDGGLSQGEPNLTAAQLTIDVESLEERLSKVTAAGGEVRSEKRPVPGVGWMATIADTEGNVFGLMQLDESAK